MNPDYKQVPSIRYRNSKKPKKHKAVSPTTLKSIQAALKRIETALLYPQKTMTVNGSGDRLAEVEKKLDNLIERLRHRAWI